MNVESKRILGMEGKPGLALPLSMKVVLQVAPCFPNLSPDSLTLLSLIIIFFFALCAARTPVLTKKQTDRQSPSGDTDT